MRIRQYCLLILALGYFHAATVAQVKLLEQHFDPATLTFDLVVQNQGQEDISLTEVEAAFGIYFYGIKRGKIGLPTLKSSARYEIPVSLSLQCNQQQYFNNVIIKKESTGIFSCKSQINADPVLFLPAGKSVRFNVQVIPKEIDTQRSMEINLNLNLFFGNEVKATTQSHLFFGDDLMAVTFPDLFLNKKRILKMVNDPNHPPETIEIPLGHKLKYSFTRSVAASHLDKINLSRDSLQSYVATLIGEPLDESNYRVRIAALELMRKHKFKQLVYQLADTWSVLSNQEENWGLLSSEMMYTLVSFDQYQYIDSVFKKIRDGTNNTDSWFFHLVNRRDSVYGEKLITFLGKHGYDFVARQNRSTRTIYRSFGADLYHYPGQRSTELIAALLTLSRNEYLIEGLIHGLLGLYHSDPSTLTFVAQFQDAYLELYHTYPGIRPALLTLLMTHKDAKIRNTLINEALAAGDKTLRANATNILIAREAEFMQKNRDEHLLWNLISQLGKGNPDKKTIKSLARQLVAPAYLSGTTPVLLKSIYYFFIDYTWDLNAAIPDSAIAFRQLFMDYYIHKGNPNRLSEQDLIHILNSYLAIDSTISQLAESVLTQRIDEKEWENHTVAEITSLATSLTQMANRYSRKREKRITYLQLATQCYQAALNRDSSAALKQSAGNTYNEMAWTLLLRKEPQAAVEACLKGLKIQPNRHILYTNLALGYLLSGKKNKAMQIYERLKDTPYEEPDPRFEGQPLKVIFLEDLKEMERQGVVDEKVKKNVEAVRVFLQE